MYKFTRKPVMWLYSRITGRDLLTRLYVDDGITLSRKEQLLSKLI